jgi:hypothetical protein
MATITALTLTAREWAAERDTFRDEVLAALDTVARATLLGLDVKAPSATPGAEDSDLPDLSKTIDAQFARIMARAGVSEEA